MDIDLPRRVINDLLHPERIAAMIETGISIVVILVAVGVAVRLCTALLHRLLRVDDPRRPAERAATIRTLVPLLESALRYVFYFVALVMILDRLHFNVAALLASAGIAGIAIRLWRPALHPRHHLGILLAL